MKSLIRILEDKTAIHCPTEEHTDMFLQVARNAILNPIIDNQPAPGVSYNKAFGDRTCFAFKKSKGLMYGSVEYLKSEGYTVISTYAMLAQMQGPSAKQQEIFDSIVAERVRQYHKHGMPNLEPVVWMAILAEEVGEASKEAVDYKFDSPTPELRKERLEAYRKELIEVAAMCFKMIEALDSNQLGV